MHHARQEAVKRVYENIDPKSSDVYHLANQFRRKNDDVGDQPVKNDAGEMSMSEDSKQKAWLEHSDRGGEVFIGGNCGLWYGCSSQYFETYPNHIPSL